MLRRSRPLRLSLVLGTGMAMGCAAVPLVAGRPAGVASAIAQPAAQGAGARVGSAGWVRLTRNVLPGAGTLPTSGSPASGATLHIGIGLRDRDAAAEAELLRQFYDPRSPLYHHFLDPAGFAARFAPDAAAYAATIDWLRAGGLRITQTASSRDWVQASGPVDRVEALFHTTLRSYTWQGQRFYANTSPPRVPDGLGIISVVGLNDLQRFQTFAQVAAATPSTGALTAKDLWSVYDQPDQNQGQGQTMAVFVAGAADTAVSNLRTFEAGSGLPSVPVRVIPVGAGPFTDHRNDLEWSLDTQASTGMAPLVQREDIYLGTSLGDADIMDVFTRWADDDVDKQASASFGECEQSPADGPLAGASGGFVGNVLEPVAEQVLARANLQGQTLFAATGDSGAFCATLGIGVNGVTYTGDPRLEYPAASPHVVAVGGTDVYTDGGSPPHRSAEVGWTHGGGGTSVFLPAPVFQRDVVTRVGRCVVSADGQTGATGAPCRGIPDVAALSGDVAGTSSFVIDDPGPTDVIGTSVASPLWLGMWTRIQAAAPDQAHGLGFADEALYHVAVAENHASTDFYDVIVGANGRYSALPGWDYVTGWGAPDVRRLMLDIAGKLAPTNDISPPAAPALTPGGAASTTACPPLWERPDHSVSGPTGDAEPQLALRRGEMTLVNDTTLDVRITLTDAETTIPPGADGLYWLMQWNEGATTYFARASLDALGTLQYDDGTVDAAGTLQGTHLDSGSFESGRGGAVSIDVPLGNIGSPRGGAHLRTPAGRSGRFIGAPNGTGLAQQADSAQATSDFVVGVSCAGPPAAAGTTPSQDGGAHVALAPPAAAPPQPSAPPRAGAQAAPGAAMAANAVARTTPGSTRTARRPDRRFVDGPLPALAAADPGISVPPLRWIIVGGLALAATAAALRRRPRMG